MAEETAGAIRSCTVTPACSTRGAAHDRACCTPWLAVSWALLASGVNCSLAATARPCTRIAWALACMAPALARDFTSWLLVLENTINLPE